MALLTKQSHSLICLQIFALTRCFGFLLPFYARLFIVLALAHLGHYTGTLTLTLEAA